MSQDHFQTTLADLPETTRVRYRYFDSRPSRVADIPTAEIFQEGDFAARRLPGVKVSLIMAALRARGIYPEYVSVIDGGTA